MKARKLSPKQLELDTPAAKQLLENIRNYATEQAYTATFQNVTQTCLAMNVFQNLLKKSQMGTLASFAIDATVPFKKTPINIIKRGIDYSPIGLVQGIYRCAFSVKKGEVTATDAIDKLASGLTGTAIMLLGQLLSAMGLLVGRGDEDDKKKSFDSMVGKQNYALKIGDTYYTVDWITPFSFPLFVGAEINNIIEEKKKSGKNINFADGVNAIQKLADPIINLSMLSGINNTLNNSAYADGDNSISGLASTVFSNYISQFIPTFSSQLARITDPQTRTIYHDKNSSMPAFLDKTIQTLMKKIPGASKLLNPKIDDFGRPIKDKNNVALRTFENLFSPGYISSENIGEVEKVLNDIYGETGDNSVFPPKARKSLTIDEVKNNMDGKTYTKFAKVKGQTAYDMLNSMIEQYGFKILPTEDKVKVVKRVYTYANNVAKYECFGVKLKGYSERTYYSKGNKAAIILYTGK